MFISKKIMSLCMTVLSAAVITGCGVGGGTNPDGKIFFASHDKPINITGQILEGIQKPAQADGREVEFQNSDGNANLQVDQVNAMIAEKPAAIVLLAVDGDTIVPAVKKANEAGIPVIATNRDVNGGKFTNVINDEKQAGRLQGEYMAKHLPQGATVVYLTGDMAISCAKDRWEGFKEACLDKRPDITLLAKSPSGDWSEADGIKNLTLWMSMFPKIDAVVSGNDNMALGAIMALKAAGRFDGVLVSGVDATEPALKSIAAGEMAQSIKQDTDRVGATIYELIKDIKNGKAPSEDNVLVPMISITKDNLAQFK